MSQEAQEQSDTIEISQADLPLHCPMSELSLWSLHPKVFLPIEETGEAKCPYCGTQYKLVAEK